jgi:predicted short-subunit dehydrogenase-like oxidoreductase (DUF2520 family)
LSSAIAEGELPRLGFIGAGVTGNAFARCLSEAGYPVVAAASRTFASAQALAARVEGCRALPAPQAVADAADLVLITTPDDAIEKVVAGLRWRPDVSVAHVSGAASLDVLEAAREAGASVGSIHPLQAFADVEQAVAALPGSTFALEGEGPLLACLEGMVAALGGRWVHLRADQKVLYHAAAVMASNYLVTLTNAAADLWQGFGEDAASATRALLPLVEGAVRNLREVGLPDCLTGPIARGDVGTVRKHLAALEASAPDLLPAYRELGLLTLPVALAKGRIGQAEADALREALQAEPAVSASGRPA